MAYNIGDRTGDYQIIDVLGAGGMGKVYKVRNIISERIEAMKVLLPNLANDPGLADRFMREIKVQASLHHPNIAALHTALRQDNQLLMLIEFVEGRTLEAVLRQGVLPPPKAVDYTGQVLQALSYAHSHGVIHRDIKPANMMLTPDGIVKLMDFGIAKLSEDRKLTQTGRTVGSLYYMSPEQIQGALDLDPRADLYSLGVSLYEMVTGTRPFQGDSDYSIMAAHLNSQPVPPIQVDNSLPSALNDVILMSIAKDPAHRFQTADAFRKALQSVSKDLRSLGSITQVVNGPVPVRAPGLQPAVAAVPTVQAAASAPRSRRGLYMAIGSLVTVAVLAVAALQGPKWFGRSQAAATTGRTQTVSAPPFHVEPAPETQAVAAPVTAPMSREPVSGRTPPMAVAQNNPVRPQATTAYQQPTPQVQTPLAEPPPPQLPAPARPVASPPVDTAQVDALESERERLLTLGSRANAARAALARMKEQQARQGLGMRGDILASQERMEAYLDDAQAAIRSGDAERAKKTLSSAEREIDRLDTFLGR